MKKSKAILSAIVLSTALTATGGVSAHSANNQPPSASGNMSKGSGMMNDATTQNMMQQNTQNMMPQYKRDGNSKMPMQGMGHGMMMGNGYHNFQSSSVDRNFSSDDVRKILEGHLVWMGHKRLKTGDIKAQEDGTLLADITTIDGSLVMRIEVDPKTGAMHTTDQ